MLTIFSLPKAFKGHIKTIQVNAILSWLKLDSGCEIILLGDDEGTAEAADRFGVRYYPGIERNEYGTPLVSSVFDKGQSLASNDIVCYVNADIILLSDFLTAIRQIKMSSFLAIGQRWDLDVRDELDFNTPGWEDQLRTRLLKNGELHNRSGLDYFIFRRGFYQNIPPFAIGRTTWDNWLIYRARYLGSSVIDATQAVVVVHQNHDYSHNPGGTAGVWKGPEAVRNRELAGCREHAFTLEHATWILSSQGVRRALSPRYLYFRLDAMTVLSPRLRFMRRPMKALTRLLVRIRSRLGVNRNTG
ncbi:MAG: glycosyltransferase family A protein [Dehalococcoidales bacterium]|nr:glycosyltransferase family A protein [Dehalococcoidales bacterium]